MKFYERNIKSYKILKTIIDYAIKFVSDL